MASEFLLPIAPVVVMAAVMWIVEIIDSILDNRLDRFGIRPRQLDGLDGIVFSPFLHASFSHLIANTVPFLVLGGVIAIGGAARFVKVTVIVAVIGGGGTWLTGGSHTLVIGASGLVFGYLLCLLTRGIFARRFSYILGGVIVLVLYGSVLWGILPTHEGISWQDHLFGAIGGIVAAYAVYRAAPLATASVAPNT